MSKRDAAREKRPNVRKGKVPGSGGRRRGQMEVDELVDQVIVALDYGQGRYAISTALGQYMQAKGWQPSNAPMPLATVDDYIRRAREQLAAERKLTREEARIEQARRVKRRMLKADADKRHRDALACEEMLIRIEGTALPSKVELGGPDGEPLLPRGPSEVVDALRRLVGDGKPSQPAPADGEAPPAEGPDAAAAAPQAPVAPQEG